jgi:hypothetical protein
MVQVLHNFLNWKPVENRTIRDAELRHKIHADGFAVLPLLSPDQLEALRAIYAREHKIDAESGGMFYSLYSSDFDYRLRIHQEIADILAPTLETHFSDFKNIVNSFVVKASGKQSEFYVHQDTTALDEFHFSPLSLWIPLQEIDADNGALTVIEKTHWFFSPHRGVSFGFPFNGIMDTVRKYLKPIYMQAGEVLIFDPRVIHNSMENKSGKDRIAIICGVFHKEAQFTTCFKDPLPDSPIELYRHDDDYTLRYPNFFYDCHVRPVSGEKFAEVAEVFPDMDAETFEKLCALNHIEPAHALGTASELACNMIAEPDGVNKFPVKESPVVAQKSNSGFFRLFKRNRA